MSPLIFVTIGVILVFTPLSVLASVFLVRLYREDTTNHLAATLAVMGVTRTVAALLLAIPTVLFVFGIATPWAGQLVLVSLDMLLVTNVVVAGYLFWLRR